MRPYNRTVYHKNAFICFEIAESIQDGMLKYAIFTD
jgi:hypothetical protein